MQAQKNTVNNHQTNHWQQKHHQLHCCP